MTQAIDLSLRATPTAETKFVATVCFVHFASHYYITLLAPLFLFVRADYDVTYTQLGLAFTAFNVVSTALQTPTGFLVDRVSARLLLIVGLMVGAAAFAIAALVDSYWVFVAMFALAGLGNTVYHPADYALLSRHVPAARAGRAFSLHTFAGMLGNAAAPPSLLFLYGMVGWRGAFLGAAVLGLVAALVMAVAGEPPSSSLRPSRRTRAAPGQATRRQSAPPRWAGASCSRPRSCSISHSSSCSRCRAGRFTTSWSRRSVRSMGRRSRSAMRR